MLAGCTAVEKDCLTCLFESVLTEQIELMCFQGTPQQPNMPAYGPPKSQGASHLQQGPLPSNLMPLKTEVPAAPMGPPPPRLPAQFGMGSMGPPPPRTAHPQGISVVKLTQCVLFCMPRVVAKYISSSVRVGVVCMQEQKTQSFPLMCVEAWPCAAVASHDLWKK